MRRKRLAVRAGSRMLCGVFLSRQQLTFSEVFYQRHRAHLIRIFRKAGIYLAASGIITTLFFLAYRSGKASFWEFALCALVLVWVLFGIVRGVPQSFRVRLVPYFEQRLNLIDSFSAGTALLNNSRLLDDVAAQLGVRLLSEFASGDDLIPGEELRWHGARPALESVDALLSSPAAKAFPPELLSDLTRLQDALSRATSREVRFCLLIRESSPESAPELEKRRGSFH